MNLEMVVMRVLHILAGVIWAGSAIFLAAVLDPRLKTLGPDTQRRVMGALAPGLRIALDGSAAVTILVGLALVIRLERNLFDLSSGWAWAILIGIVTSVVAVASGAVAISASKRAAASDDDADAARLSSRATLLGRITAVLVVIAVASMASARFV
jgi:uncharacterized membrane protein